MRNTHIIKIDGKRYTVYQVNNDINGNPRYVIHFLTLGLEDYISLPGILKKYRGRDFGGGYVFSSYNVQETLKYILEQIKDYLKDA